MNIVKNKIFVILALLTTVFFVTVQASKLIPAAKLKDKFDTNMWNHMIKKINEQDPSKAQIKAIDKDGIIYAFTKDNGEIFGHISKGDLKTVKEEKSKTKKKNIMINTFYGEGPELDSKQLKEIFGSEKWKEIKKALKLSNFLTKMSPKGQKYFIQKIDGKIRGRTVPKEINFNVSGNVGTVIEGNQFE